MVRYNLGRVIKSHQYKTVAPGQKDVIFYAKIPKPYKAFITFTKNSWYPETEVIIYIDGNFVDKILEEHLDEPLEWKPPLEVNHEIKVIARNNSTADHVFEFVVMGYVEEVDY